MTVTVRAALERLRDWAVSPSRATSLLDASVWTAPLRAEDAAGASDMPMPGALEPELVPILGEFVWHSLTVDPRLSDVSEEHYAVVAGLFVDASLRAQRDARVLEVGAYAHTTGYLLYQRLGARTDLLDISPSTLRLGRRIAREQGLPTEGTTCVAGDFHALPYADEQFDLVYICSALHHTWRWRRVLAEMVRVLAPGGILLLENEPCRRLFCHYRFRANRLEDFGELERALDQRGILRTVAEPFPNTRPETLFGMVENQTIPIAALCGALATGCAPVAVTVNHEVCMGALERELVARRREGAAALTHWLMTEMTKRVDEAAMAMSAVDRGMGFGLPAHDEIARLCASTVEALIKLPLEAESADFQMGLADIFGASARIAVRKKGARRAAPAARLAQDYPRLDDVVYAFPARIARLLDPRNMLLPDIQSSAIAALNDVFPPADWTLATSADGLRSFVPVTREPSCIMPVSGPGPLLLLVRLYVAVEGRPFRVMLCSDDDELAGFDAYRADSLMLTPIVHCPPGASRLRVSIRTKGLGAAPPLDSAPVFTVSYLGAFDL